MHAWLAALFALLSAALSLLFMGPGVGAIVLALVVAYPVYLRTFHQRLPEPAAFLPVYLGAVAWQLLHFAEEFATDFQVHLPELAGTEPWSAAEFVAFNMCFYALFLLAAIAVLVRVRALTYFASFFVVATFVNGIGHPLLALRVGGYFPGLVTGTLSLVWAVLMARALRAPR